MHSVFSRIVNGEIPAYRVAEDEKYLAFLDINPLQEGHTLVIPKTEVDYLFDLDPELQGGLWVFAARVAKGIEKVVPCKRIGVTVIGLEVPHAHIHLIPLKTMHDMDFSKKKMNPPSEKLRDLAGRIAAAINMP
jgi:histidine triad (HIT) family protein